MSNLVLFTNRSGSTILTDLLAYRDGSVNLGEGLHSAARNYNFNTNENKKTLLYKQFSYHSLTAAHHNYQTRGSDYIGFFEAKQRRINLLKTTDIQWTVKEMLEKLTLDMPFIKYCASNNINVYLTHRQDIVSQFISKVNARYRSEIAEHNHYSNFIYTNQCKFTDYDEMRIKFNWLHMYTNIFVEQLMVWRIVYEQLKSYNLLKIVSYENEIKPMNLARCGIDNNILSKYNNERQHLVPTPKNATKVIVQDDNTKQIVGAWQQALYYVERHKYLVEV